MMSRFIALVLLAAITALASFPADAQQKTVKQCNDEWAANKVKLQASGKTKKAFVAECRGQVTAAAPKPSRAAPKPPGTAAPSPAANVKTAKQCNEEWTANKAAIQASKKSKKQFLAECRAQPAGTATAKPAPSTATPPATPPKPSAPAGASTSRSTAAAPAQPSTPPASPAKPSAPTAASTSPSTAAPTARPSTPPASARPRTAAAPTVAGQFTSEAQAKARCPSDTVVWVNTGSNIYHFATGRNYGKTKSGAYMCERDATAAGARAAKNEKHP
jgi:hypothetical protein